MTLCGEYAQAAAFTLNAFSADTTYGATNYVPKGNANPTHILNNFDNITDILSSPGGGYQTANPVIGNNVASTGVLGAPYVYGWTGGLDPISGAAFGSGITAVNASAVGWGLSDITVGCCTASYMITSIDEKFTVANAAYTGTFGAYLSIAGDNLTASDSGVASEIVEYSVNGGAFVSMPQMVLAAGGHCNNAAIGGATGTTAAIEEAGCNGDAYVGLAVDNLGAQNWAVGTTIQIIATITSYADPASGDTIDSYVPHATLIAATGASLSGFTGSANSGVTAPTPEPATLGLSGLFQVSLGLLRRRRQ